jgi:hypothetical protein
MRSLAGITTLFFVILLIEVDLGHQLALQVHDRGLALLPVIWIPIALIALMWMQLRPSPLSRAFVRCSMAIAAVVGIVGFFAHLVASGVTLTNPSRLFDGQVWSGPACPNWPIAITVAAVLGLIAGLTSAGETVDWLRVAAFTFVVAGIVLSLIPASSAAGSAALVAAALLLFASALTVLTESRKEAVQ